jgi:glyoxylase-like metal-dependent hydrolase (beta-lactamase superfamily II)
MRRSQTAATKNKNVTAFICTACGTQFPESNIPPNKCRICQDPRQFIPPQGQQWTTLEQLQKNHRNIFHQHEPNLFGVGTTPDFAIGQRALLIRSASGNFLWDCIALLDATTIEIINSLGGLRGIAISHPHYYTTMVDWSRAFGDTTIYLHAADREWVMRPDDAIEFWDGPKRELAAGVTLVHCGGHFAGGTVLHWKDGADGRGVLLTGDILQVTPDGFVSFMYSYPNLTPLSANAVRAIAAAVAPLSYDRIYGAWWERQIEANAKEIVGRSVTRYLNAIEGK